MDSTPLTLTCCDCRSEKAADEYHRQSSRPSGRQARCKACCREYQRRYYAANREKRTVYRREWRAANGDRSRAASRAYYQANREVVANRSRRWKEANPEKVKESRQRYYWTHHERVLEIRQAYREANRELVLRSLREWREKNPEKVAANNRLRRARYVTAIVGIVDEEALWTGLCGICADPLDPSLKRPDPMSKSLDHIMPIARGGTHEQSNLQWTHLLCNMRKGARLPESG